MRRGRAWAVFTAIISSLTMPNRRSRERKIARYSAISAARRLRFSAISSRPSAVRRCQAQVEDGAGLLFRQTAVAVLVEPVAEVVDQRHQLRHVVRRPQPAHQGGAGFRRVGRGADQADDLVDVGDGDGEADLHAGAVAGLVELEFCAAADDVFTKVDEGAQASR